MVQVVGDRLQVGSRIDRVRGYRVRGHGLNDPRERRPVDQIGQACRNLRYEIPTFANHCKGGSDPATATPTILARTSANLL